MRRFLWRLLDVILRRHRDNRLSEEIQSHLDLLTDDHIARGLSPADARVAALRSFSSVDQIKERYRDMITLLSCTAPVRRSLRIDPLVAVRDE